MGLRRIWVTRTQPEADATATKLRAKGHTPVVAPVLEARAIAGTRLDLTGVDALAFTSAHAIAAFAALSPERALPAFTVGQATAEKARDAGFADVRPGDGDARALFDGIARAAPKFVLHPGAREPAADLAALLAERGVQARAVPVYETLAVDLASPPGDIDAVLIHSARAARLVAGLLSAAGHSDLDVFAISQAAAGPLRALGLVRIVAAPFPNEAALLDLIA